MQKLISVVWSAALFMAAGPTSRGEDSLPPTAMDPNVRFEQLDANRDGRLSPDESPQDLEPLLKRLIEHCDKDDDGSLTFEELLATMAGGGNGKAPLTVAADALVLFQPPIPSQADTKAARKRLRTDYESEFQDATESKQMVKLAVDLLDRAEEKDIAGVDRYALLTAARDLAVEAVEPALLVRTIDMLAAQYAVERLPMMANYLRKTAAVAANPKFKGKPFAAEEVDGAVVLKEYDPRVDLDELASAALSLARQGLVFEQFDQAAELGIVARSISRKSKNRKLTKEAADVSAEIVAARKNSSTDAP